MLTLDQQNIIKETVCSGLDGAENTWSEFGERLVCLANESPVFNRKNARESIDTQIPGYDKIDELKPKLDGFIAIVVDMRDSTKHLMQRIAAAKVSELQRVYYETSALIPAISKCIFYEKGRVTEYLGDGVLGLFLASEGERDAAVYSSYRAAKNCLLALNIVNFEISKRYDLPPINIGIGMGFSQALVAVVGTQEHKQGKVIGRCVYDATKLACGINQIYVDDGLRNIWPTEKNGSLRFTKNKLRGVDGYLINSDK